MSVPSAPHPQTQEPASWVMVPMTDSEWLAMLSKEAAAMPEIVRYNINHQQWDSLDRNLHAIGEQVKKMRRILHAKIDPGFIENVRPLATPPLTSQDDAQR